MDSIDFGYSMKNIPLASKESYKYKLIDKTEKLLKRMRWKAYFFDKHNDGNKKKSDPIINAFRLKSRKCLQQIPEMKAFENDILTMIENIEFRRVSDEFLKKLDEDIKKINSSEKMFVPADKTQSFYQIDKYTYNKILTENVTKTYKKSSKTLRNKVNMEAKKIAKKFSIDDKMEIMAQQQCFVTVKDRKEDLNPIRNLDCLTPQKAN